MLVLSRRVSEKLLIGDDIVITVVRISDNAVRLGIEAPKDMNIIRDELVVNQKIQADETDLEDLGRRAINPHGMES